MFEYMQELLNYKYTFKVGTFDAGPHQKMRLSSILKHQEYAGECHLTNRYSLDYETILERGVVFVLVNTDIIIHRMPTLNETVTIDTWNKELKGLKFFRGYDWFDENGKKIIEGISTFVLVDAIDHRIVKASALGTELPTDSQRKSTLENPKKIHLPKELKQTGSKKVLYSMLDSNEHLNNALYAAFLIDFIDSDKVAKIKGFSIDFVKEARLGEKIEVFENKEENEIFFKGDVDNNTCFRGRLKF
mgnify:FL=1